MSEHESDTTTRDARPLPGSAQAALRERAVRAVLDAMCQVQAAAVFDAHPNAVSDWVGMSTRLGSGPVSVMAVGDGPVW